MSSKIIAGTTSGTALNMSADTTGILEIQTGSTPTTAITVDASQNVGIGTSSPATKLDINGDITQRNGGGATIGKIWNDAGIYSVQANSVNVNGLKLDAPGAQYITAFTNGSERMRIDSSGKILMGTTSAIGSDGALLNVNNNIAVNIGTTSGTAAIGFWNPNGRVGYVYTSGSTTTYVTSSDYRLKENIASMTGALDKVSALKPVTYNWKADGSNGQGFIAHELQAVVPDCVTGEKDAVDAEGKPVYQGIDTSFLVATLTAAIQELNAKVDAQAAEIKALKGVA
jgi:hypothetical protein